MTRMEPKPTPATLEDLAGLIHERIVMMQIDAEELHTTALKNCHFREAHLARELMELAADTSEIAQALESMLSRAGQ